MIKPKQYITKQKHHIVDKSFYSQSSTSHVRMWELDHKEGWATKNWRFQTVVLEKTLESPFENKEIKPVNPKETQPWIFIRKTETEAEASILWPPDGKCRLIGKDPDVGKDWRQRRKEWQRMRWWDSITDSMGMSWSKLRRIVEDRGAWCAAAYGVTKNSWKWLSDWKTTK